MGGLACFGVFPNIPLRDQPHQSVPPSRRLAQRTVFRVVLTPISCLAVPCTPLGVSPQIERSIHSGKGLCHSIGEVC
jgi:hypothetical protein